MAEQEIIQDLAPQAPFGALAGRAFRMLLDNPLLLVPPMFAGLAHLSLYAVFAWVFITSLAEKMNELQYTAWDMSLLKLNAVLLRLAWPYLLGLLAALWVGRVLIGTFHNAGWSAMFAAAARTGRASLLDYGYGVFMYAPRFLGAVAVKLAAHAIPLLFVVIMLLLLRKAGHVPTGSLLVVALPFAALVMAIEAALGLAFMFWRQSLALESAGSAESLARSFAFVRTRPGDVVVLVGMWFAYVAAVSLFFMLLGAVLMQAVSSETPQAMGLRAVLYLNTTLLSWLFHFVGMVFFVLLGFVLYHDRMGAPFEQDADTEPESISLSQALGEESVPASEPESLPEDPASRAAADPDIPESDASEPDVVSEDSPAQGEPPAPDTAPAPTPGEPPAPDTVPAPVPDAPSDHASPGEQADSAAGAPDGDRDAHDDSAQSDPGARDS